MPVRLVALMILEGGYDLGVKPGPALLANVNHAPHRPQNWNHAA